MDRHRDLIRHAYNKHKGHAKERDIPFLLTYEQWCTIWFESGKWEQRGNRRGQYVMARPGDQGAYEIGNVAICRQEENTAERNKGYSGDRHQNHGKSLWSTFKDKDKAKYNFGKSTSIVASKRTRDERGCFVTEANRVAELS